jgi:hypothetical protein
MNGAELPCGITMQVQPSDPLHKLKKKMDYCGSAEGTTIQEAPLTPLPPVDKKDVAAEDQATTTTEEDGLDEFFASLE